NRSRGRILGRPRSSDRWSARADRPRGRGLASRRTPASDVPLLADDPVVRRRGPRVPHTGSSRGTGRGADSRSQGSFRLAPPPPLVRPVPVDGLPQAGLERGLRLPPEAVPELRPIDRMPDDVARAVGHPLQERLRLGEGPEDRLPNLEDRSLRGRADVERLT